MNKKNLSFSYFVALSLFLVCVNAYASEPWQECKRALVPDIVKLDTTDEISLAILNIIDKKDYQDAQKSGSLFGKIPVKGIPIEVNVGYEEWDKGRKTYHKKHSYDLDAKQSIGYLRANTKNENIQAFVRCMESSTATTHGFHMYISEVLGNIVKIQSQWIAPPPNPRTAKPKKKNGIVVTGGKLLNKPNQWLPNEQIELLATRKVDEPFVVVINTDQGFSDSVSLQPKQSRQAIIKIKIVAESFEPRRVNPAWVVKSIIVNDTKGIKVNISGVEASSCWVSETCSSGNGLASSVIDNDLSNWWSPNINRDHHREWIEIQLERPVYGGNIVVRGWPEAAMMASTTPPQASNPG